MNDAIGEIKSLEAAIDLLGPASVHAKPLLTALKAAQERSKMGPIQERLGSCRQFVERAKKRVLRADEVIARAVEQKAIFEAEVAQAEQRIVLLQAEAAATTPAVVPEPAQVKELQTQIDLLVRERDALKSAPGRQVGGGEESATWMGSGPPCVENIPPMPTFGLQDLERWMCDRNCDLRNAMEFGDSSLISKIGGLVGQGAGQLEILSRDVSMDGRSKSSLMSSLIETADAKRRCVIAGIDGASGPSQGRSKLDTGFVESGLEKLHIQARPGGATDRRISADAVLTSLEAALTRIDDSNDESQPIVPTWRDIDSGTEGHGGRSVRARIGDVASPVASAPPSSLLDSLEGALLESDDEPLVRLPHVGADHEGRVVLRLSGESQSPMCRQLVPSVQPAVSPSVPSPIPASADPLRCGGGPGVVEARESVPDFSPATPVAQVIDMTVADSDDESGVQDRDGFLSVLSQRSRRRVVVSAIPATVSSVQANRFSPLNAEIEAVVESQGPRARRRLTIVGGHDVPQHPSASQFDIRATVPDFDDSVDVANTMEDHSDGESAGSAVDEVPEGEVDVEPQVVRLSPEIRDALISLDSVDLQSVFRRRACVMRSCPAFLVGSYRAAMRLAMEVGNCSSSCHGCSCSDHHQGVVAQVAVVGSGQRVPQGLVDLSPRRQSGVF